MRERQQVRLGMHIVDNAQQDLDRELAVDEDVERAALVGLGGQRRRTGTSEGGRGEGELCSSP